MTPGLARHVNIGNRIHQCGIGPTPCPHQSPPELTELSTLDAMIRQEQRNIHGDHSGHDDVPVRRQHGDGNADLNQRRDG